MSTLIVEGEERGRVEGGGGGRDYSNKYDNYFRQIHPNFLDCLCEDELHFLLILKSNGNYFKR